MIVQKFYTSGGGMVVAQKTTRGCTLLRYTGGVGTFIEYKSPANTDAVMEVIDAQYRPTATYKWADTTGTNTNIPDITVYASYYIYNNATYSHTSAMASAVTMSYLLTNHKSKWTEDGTAKANNQYIKTYAYPAGYYCYGLSIDSSNGKWLLPTAWQMQVIWMLSDAIDDIENPDTSYYAASKLGYKASNGRFKNDIFWSCSEYSLNRAWCVSYGGYTNGGLVGTNNFKTTEHYVLPIREH